MPSVENATDAGGGKRLISFHLGGQEFGAGVDRIQGIEASQEIARRPEDIESPPDTVSGAGSEMVEGVGRMDARLLIVINPDNILSEEERAALPK
jgi:chemotaxis signal transduction protein